MLKEIKRYSLLALSGVALIVLLVTGGSLVEVVDSGEIVVMQDPIDGDITIYRTPGTKLQLFARVTSYNQSYQYGFTGARTTFNDKGGADFQGSLRWDMPISDDLLLELHNKFGSKGGEEAIERELIRPAVYRAVFNTGPLMSSTESAAERRSDILFFAIDQARYGVYKTTTKEGKAADPITGEEKTVAVVELTPSDAPSDHNYRRQESSPVAEFGIEISDFTVENIVYDEAVQQQIEDQRKITTDVQTAVANAVKAEQDAITAQQQGIAQAARARADQEVDKAKAVTLAEQKYEVAVLDRRTAEERKQEAILLGQGEAEAQRLKFNADGALQIKLNAMLEMNKAWADAYSKSSQPNVPGVFFGGAGDGVPSGTSAVERLASMKMLELATQFNVDLKPPGK